jgi:hypothetical protein
VKLLQPQAFIIGQFIRQNHVEIDISGGFGVGQGGRAVDI